MDPDDALRHGGGSPEAAPPDEGADAIPAFEPPPPPPDAPTGAAAPLPTDRIPAWAILAFWGAYGVIASFQQALVLRFRTPPAPLWDGFALQLPGAAMWAAATPAIVHLARRYPLSGRRWPRHLVIHLAAGYALVLATHLVFQAYAPLIISSPSDQRSWLTRSWESFGVWALADTMLYWIVVAAAHLRRQTARAAAHALREAELHAQLARAKLDALTIRLQPHFLFNTLHAISTLVLEDPKAANRMITRLSDLLRMTMHRTRSPFVPLEQELDLLGHYVALMELRHGDRLRATVAVETDVGDVRVPGLIFQPIVENAIQHAIGDGDRTARVEVSVRRKGGRVRVAVSDNGPGFAREGKGAGGEGISNTRARLREAYGSHYKLELLNHPAGGASVAVEVPPVPPADSGGR